MHFKSLQTASCAEKHKNQSRECLQANRVRNIRRSEHVCATRKFGADYFILIVHEDFLVALKRFKPLTTFIFCFGNLRNWKKKPTHNISPGKVVASYSL